MLDGGCPDYSLSTIGHPEFRKEPFFCGVCATCPTAAVGRQSMCDGRLSLATGRQSLCEQSRFDGTATRAGLAERCPSSRSGRVELWRGSIRFGLSVSAPFVWRCPSTLALTPFPQPAHRTGRADLPHPALGQDITPSYTASHYQGPCRRTRPKCP